MKTIVLYRSISGFTEKYARWIGDELGADIFDRRKVKPEALSGYQCVVYCGSLHQGLINGVDILTRNFDLLADKRVIVLVTGGSAAKAGLVEEILAVNFTEEQRRWLRLFYLRGGFDFRKLDFKNRVLMSLRIARLRKKRAEDLSSDERDLLAARETPANATDKEAIRPILDYARSPAS